MAWIELSTQELSNQVEQSISILWNKQHEIKKYSQKHKAFVYYCYNQGKNLLKQLALIM